MVLTRRLKVRERRLAADWLRNSTGAFVPEKYADRAAELSSSKQRVMLAKTLRKVERTADQRVVGRVNILNLAAVRAHRRALRSLVALLEDEGEPVTAVGMLRARDLITQTGSPLYGTNRGARLDAEIAATIDVLRQPTERAAA